VIVRDEWRKFFGIFPENSGNNMAFEHRYLSGHLAVALAWFTGQSIWLQTVRGAEKRSHPRRDRQMPGSHGFGASMSLMKGHPAAGRRRP